MTAAHPSRRAVLRGIATGVVGTAAISTHASAQASGPTVYAATNDGVLHAVGAVSGDVVWTVDDFKYTGDHESSPIVVDGTVLIGSGAEAVHAFDGVTGEEVWAFEAPEGDVHSDPTVVDGTVYVGANGGNLYAIDLESGEREWVFQDPTGPVRSAPQVVDGTVYVGSDDTNLYAVDAATGEREWVFDYPTRPIVSAPTVAGSVYVQTREEVVYAVDPVTGERQWIFDEYKIEDDTAPVVVDGTVYTVSFESSDSNDDNDVHAVDAATGEEVWTAEEVWNVPRTPTVYEGTVYAGHRELFAMDAETGEVQWSYMSEDQSQLGDHAPMETGPTVHDGTLYAGASTGRIFAVDAETGDERWITDQPGSEITGVPTVVADPDGGDSVGSRVRTGTFGHTDEWAETTTVSSESASGSGGNVSDPSGDDGLPGPGIAGSLAALGGAGYLLANRRKDGD